MTEPRAYNIDDGGEFDNFDAYLIPDGSLGPGLVDLRKVAEPGPTGTLARAFGSIMVDTLGGYPDGLPDDLEPWYVYIVDSGHCIGVVPKAIYQEGGDNFGNLAPAPVKVVLRSTWEVRGGWIVADVPYRETSGVLADDADYEFEGGSGYDEDEEDDELIDELTDEDD
jgi:hypothetical protein